MYKNVLQQIDNIAIWPIISLIIFFSFFIILLGYVFTADKGFVRYMKQLPLEGKDDTQSVNPKSANV